MWSVFEETEQWTNINMFTHAESRPVAKTIQYHGKLMEKLKKTKK
jgi:hypothetical protein